jgi:hypothetical protein
MSETLQTLLFAGGERLCPVMTNREMRDVFGKRHATPRFIRPT